MNPIDEKHLLEELGRWKGDLEHQIDNYYAADKVELRKLKHHLSIVEKAIEVLSRKG